MSPNLGLLNGTTLRRIYSNLAGRSLVRLVM
jgi:hypothetical protein